jgi:hypothetical protein
MRTLIMITLLSGCLAQTETNPVECAWTPENTCPEGATYSSQKRLGLQDEGESTCWYYDTVCTTEPARVVPDACRRQFVTCQPTQQLGGP